MMVLSVRAASLMALPLALCCGHAMAQIYRCTSETGGMVLQQAPCSGPGQRLTVKPATGQVSAEPAPMAASAPRSNVEKAVQALEDERIRREQWFVMNGKAEDLDRLRASCDEEQRRIAARKRDSSNNLAGATRDVAISNEMLAAAQVCDTKVKVAARESARAAANCEKIKCIAPNW